ncbi:GcrA family cell cycle regulator [Mesorhizobium amorphae]
MSALLDWTTVAKAERDRIVRQACADGLSSSKIADLFQNCTRSAILGHIHRLKARGVKIALPGTRPERSKKFKVPAAPKPPAPAPAKHRRTPKLLETLPNGKGTTHSLDFKARAEDRAASPGLTPAQIAGEPKRPISTAVVPLSRRLRLEDLERNDCRWPSGDPLKPDFGFCGHDTGGEHRYCTFHRGIAYVAPPPPKPRPARTDARNRA